MAGNLYCMAYENLKKSLYKAFKKALGSKQGIAQAANDIALDINDSNMIVNTPPSEVPAPKESVLHKDISPAEIHQQKQAQAEAKLGMTPKVPSMKKVGYDNKMGQKGIDKLKMFIETLSLKKKEKVKKQLK